MNTLRTAMLFLCLTLLSFAASAAQPVHHASHKGQKVTVTHVRKMATKAPVKVATARRTARPPGTGLTLTSPAEQCLATAMYREARGEGDKGMAGVGYLIKNRAEHAEFPDTICGVVLQRKPGCQFTCGWSTDAINQKEFAHVKELAQKVILGEAKNPIGKSIYFNEVSQVRKPSKRAVLFSRLGHHAFYLDGKSPNRKTSLPAVRSASTALLAER